MKPTLILTATLLLTVLAARVQAQDTLSQKFGKKFIYGGTFQHAWTSIKGSDLPRTYFTKPSLGGTLVAEYYLFNIIGAGGGIGFQQRGAGIKNPDVVKDLGNGDSTYRERLRFQSWEIPLYLVVHSPEVLNNLRFSGRFGVIWSTNFRTQNIFHSVEDGFHKITYPGSDYYETDLLYSGSLGADINAGNHAIFQVHVFLQSGTKNVFRESGTLSGHAGLNHAYGIQLGFFY